MPNRPPSAFSIGQLVRVVLPGGKDTVMLGTIRDVIWHFQFQHYDYYLEVGGQRILRSYSERELESAEGGG